MSNNCTPLWREAHAQVKMLKNTTCSSEMRWFPEKGCILEHQIFRFAEMISRDRCSTSYDLASLFRGRRSNLDRWSRKIAKRIGTRLSALHSTFHFWRQSRSIASLLILDVINFQNGGSLAELLRFWCCQVGKLWTSRRIAPFLMLSTSKMEEISQNSFVFKLAGRQIDRWQLQLRLRLRLHLQLQLHYITLHYATPH